MSETVPRLRATLHERLRGGATCIGLAACVMRTPEIVTVARACGFDMLLIDMEHGPIGIADAAVLALAAHEAGFPALARVGGPHAPDLARVLDCGAEGVVVPHVDSAEEARRVVARCRFPPLGRRSLPSPLVRLDFRMPPAAAMMRQVEGETFVALMIESAAGLAEAEAIAAVPGVDLVMVGANDLAADLGHAGAVDHPEVLAAFAAIAAAARRAGILFGVIGVAEPLLPSHAVALGARLIVATNDINLLIDQGLAVAARVRAAVAPA